MKKLYFFNIKSISELFLQYVYQNVSVMCFDLVSMVSLYVLKKRKSQPIFFNFHLSFEEALVCSHPAHR